MDDLLMKYIKGEATPKEREQILRWIDEDSSHIRKYHSLRKLYTLSLWGISSNELEDRVTPQRGRYLFKRHFFYEWLKIAAALLIGILGTYKYLSYNDKDSAMQTVYVPKGQRAEILLVDGTKVWLNSGSNLIFPTQFQGDSRQVELNGEGYFVVARNEEAPFTVRTKLCDVKVLGTEFNVKAYNASNVFETSLIKGSVEVKSRVTEKSLRLMPNESVSQVDGALKKEKITNMDYFRWKEGLFCFDDETIESIIEKLEYYYDVKIVLKRTDLSHHHFTGKFRVNDGIEHALRVLKLRHHFDFYRNQEDKNLITIY